MAITSEQKELLNRKMHWVARRVGLGTLIENAETPSNASVITKVLTGFTAGAGTIAATDSILSAFNKIVGNLAAKVPNKSLIYSGKFTTAGGDTAEAITQAGVLATDIVMVQVQSGTGYVVSATAAENAVNVVMSADPGAATVLNWLVFR